MRVNLRAPQLPDDAARIAAFQMFAGECARLGIELAYALDVRDRETFEPLPAHVHGVALVAASTPSAAKRMLRGIVDQLPAMRGQRCRFDLVRDRVKCRDGEIRDGLDVWCGYLGGKPANTRGGIDADRLLCTPGLRPRALCDCSTLVVAGTESLPRIVRPRKAPTARPRADRACVICGQDVSAKRTHAVTCGPTCRKRLERGGKQSEHSESLGSARSGSWS